MDSPVLANQQKLTNSVRTLDALLKIYQEEWSIGTDGERVLRKSMLLVCFDGGDVAPLNNFHVQQVPPCWTWKFFKGADCLLHVQMK